MAAKRSRFLLTLWPLLSLSCCAPAGVAALHGAPASPSDSVAGDGSGSGRLTQSCPRPNIWFSELLYDPEGADGAGDREFVEWMGDPGTDFRGHRLLLINGADNRAYAELALTFRMPEDGVAVAGGAAVLVDLPLPAVLQNGPDRAELIRDCDGAIVDTVAWPVDGVGAADGRSIGRCSRDSPWQAMRRSPGVDNAATADCATFPTAEDAGIDAGRPDTDALDTGIIADTRSGAQLDAGAPASDASSGDTDTVATVPSCTSGASGWQIHEVLYDPDGADTPDTEFVELRWAADGPPVPAQLRLRHINGADMSTLWDRAFVASGDSDLFIVTGTRDAGGDISEPAARLPLLQNGPDSLQLLDCNEALIDEVAWAPRADSSDGDSASARSGEAITRCIDRTSPDYRHFGAARPTPGALTESFVDAGFCSAPCTDAPEVGRVFIAEISADPPGSDDGAEWFILGGEPGETTGRLFAEHLSADTDTARWSAPIDGRFDASDGSHIVGGERVIPRDTDLPGALLNRAGRLHLLDCHGRQLDAVGWGYPGAALPSSSAGCRFARSSIDEPWLRCCGETESTLSCESAALP